MVPLEDEREGRMLAAGYPFFKTSPYVNVVVFDSHGPECDRNYESHQSPMHPRQVILVMAQMC
jgi:hypothetical protein